MRRLILILALLIGGAAIAATMNWPPLLSRPHPNYDARIAYGADPLQHIDLWLAARAGLKPRDPLWRAHPLPIHAAISLGGLPDLEAASVAPGDTCDTEPVDRLVGKGRRSGDPYADTSLAPPAFAEAYEKRVANRHLRRVTIPDEGHVELIAPETKAWAATVREIEAALR